MSCPFPALRHLGKATSFYAIYKTPAMIVGVFLFIFGPHAAGVKSFCFT